MKEFFLKIIKWFSTNPGIISSIITGLFTIGSLYFFTKPMNNYYQNQSPLVINNPRIIPSFFKDITFYGLDQDKKTFKNHSLSFDTPSGKVIDSKWYYIEKDTWDRYYELRKNNRELNTKESVVSILSTVQKADITPITKKDKKIKYSGDWRLDKSDRSPGANMKGYYFLVLTDGNGKKHMYGVIIQALTFVLSNPLSNNSVIPLNQLPLQNFSIRLVDEADAKSIALNPNFEHTGSAAQMKTFIYMYQNFKNSMDIN